MMNEATTPVLTWPWGLSVVCLLAVALLLWADRAGWSLGRAAAKTGASTCFVSVAWALDAQATPYGRLILLALMLSWLGDVLLLASRFQWAFLAGLAAFLLAHVTFAIAFARAGVMGGAVVLATVPAVAVGWFVLRWLKPHLSPAFRLPVVAYVCAIMVMCVLAVAHAVSSAAWMVLLGAMLLAASDVSVARDQFVCNAFVNRLWGWPTYFVAQLLLAWSVWAHRLTTGGVG